MLEFKSPEDLSKLPPDDPAFPIVEDLVKRLITDYIAEGYEYRPEDDGWICVMEEQDKDRVLAEIWSDWTLLDTPWEGITFRDGFYQAVFLANDQFGIVFIIPDAPWVDGELRDFLKIFFKNNISVSPLDLVYEGLRNGDLAYFVTHMPEPIDPTHETIEFENENFSVAGGYHRVVQEAITACKSGEKCLLTHIDLIFLVGLLVSKCPLTKVKLTKFLGHHRIPIRPHTVGDTSKRGFKVKWHATKSELAQWEQLLTGKHLRLVK